jgi:hypothetical protein
MPKLFVARHELGTRTRVKYTDSLDTLPPNASGINIIETPEGISMKGPAIKVVRETIERLGWLFCWEVGEEFYETPEED